LSAEERIVSVLLFCFANVVFIQDYFWQVGYNTFVRWHNRRLKQKENEMRKLVVTEFISLDGVIGNPMWTFEFWNDQIANFKAEEQENSDAMLLGRITYDGFAQAWPGRDEPGADWMNNTPKYVVSTTLKSADWNNSTIIRENVAAEVAKLKQQDGANILVYGSSVLVDALIQAGLVDELRLLLYPVVVGSGDKLFKENSTAKFKLVSSESYSSGVTGLIYHRADPEEKAE
jgi:dihydrofolate reductase